MDTKNCKKKLGDLGIMGEKQSQIYSPIFLQGPIKVLKEHRAEVCSLDVNKYITS